MADLFKKKLPDLLGRIDLVRWTDRDTTIAGERVYAWKYPETNLSTYSQLLVTESQEAVLFSKGRLIGKFGPGKHTLNTENLPFLRNLFDFPFREAVEDRVGIPANASGLPGRDNPFTAEVWFVDKRLPFNIDWSCDQMLHHDPDYQTMVPLAASGRYGLRVDDAERFLLQLVGTDRYFTARQLTDHFQGELVSKTKSAILGYMAHGQIGIKTINAHLSLISDGLKQAMAPFWEQFGFALMAFYVTAIQVDGSNEAGQRILEAMSRQSAQVIGGYSYQQQRALDIASDAAKNSSGGLLGVLMMGNLFGSNPGIMQPTTPQLPGTGTPTASGQPPAVSRKVFCSNCAKPYSNENKFCPHCGDPYTPCPRCMADNDARAQRCVSCGNSLSGPAQVAFGSMACPQCGRALEAAHTFCPDCGKKVNF